MESDDRPHSLSRLDDLLAEAERTPVDGWDFARLGDRIRFQPRPWDFAAIVSAHSRDAASLLDLGTGGGEWLASLGGRPPRTVATESWPPNVPVAEKRLAPLGITVVHTEPVPDNTSGEVAPPLPFGNGEFDLVCSRHEAYSASEVARVLAPGGVFVTQQTGGDYGDFHELLGLPRPPRPEPAWTLAYATRQLEACGLRVVDGDESSERVEFADAGAFAWYLRAIPWVVDGFSVAVFRDALAQLDTPAVAHQPTFWLKARSA